MRPALSSHHVSRVLSRRVRLPISWIWSRGGGGAGSRGAAAAKWLWEGLGVGAGGCLLIADTGHVTGRAPDGRRPSSLRPERPARPRPWGAATAARTRTRTRCGRGGRGSGMRAETLGRGTQKKTAEEGEPDDRVH